METTKEVVQRGLEKFDDLFNSVTRRDNPSLASPPILPPFPALFRERQVLSIATQDDLMSLAKPKVCPTESVLDFYTALFSLFSQRRSNDPDIAIFQTDFYGNMSGKNDYILIDENGQLAKEDSIQYVSTITKNWTPEQLANTDLLFPFVSKTNVGLYCTYVASLIVRINMAGRCYLYSIQ
jgi:hypothetical protein